MATVEEVKMKAQLRRQYVYQLKKTTGKTDKELGKELGIHQSQVNYLYRAIEFQMRGINAKEDRKERQFQRDLAYLLPILEDIKGLIKNGGC